MNTQEHELHSVTAERVDDARRMGTLSRYFAEHAVRFEAAVFDFMRHFSVDYRGGFWQFYELSNGGFYMAPDRGLYRFLVDTNGYEGTLSADAAGITVCLFACSHLSFQERQGQLLAERFHQLREFAIEHRDASQIFAAID